MNNQPKLPMFRVDVPQENLQALYDHKAQFPHIEQELIRMKAAGIDTSELDKQHQAIKDKINKFLAVYGNIK